jgi:hypothetical protein
MIDKWYELINADRVLKIICRVADGVSYYENDGAGPICAFCKRGGHKHYDNCEVLIADKILVDIGW